MICAVVSRFANSTPRSVPDAARTSLICLLSCGACAITRRRSGSDALSCAEIVLSPLAKSLIFAACRRWVSEAFFRPANRVKKRMVAPLLE